MNKPLRVSARAFIAALLALAILALVLGFVLGSWLYAAIPGVFSVLLAVARLRWVRYQMSLSGGV